MYFTITGNTTYLWTLSLSDEAVCTNCIVLSLTRPGIEPMIYNTRGSTQTITPQMRFVTFNDTNEINICHH